MHLHSNRSTQVGLISEFLSFSPHTGKLIDNRLFATHTPSIVVRGDSISIPSGVGGFGTIIADTVYCALNYNPNMLGLAAMRSN